MSTAASLVVGADGSTTVNGTSQGVSSLADRSVFLTRRKEFDVIIIGGNTARTEPYERTPVPLVVLTRSGVNPVPENPKAHIWSMEPALAIERASKEFGENILIEAGASLISEMLDGDLIDEFFLTVTPIQGGENVFNWLAILDNFQFVEKRQLEGTLFYHAFH